MTNVSNCTLGKSAPGVAAIAITMALSCLTVGASVARADSQDDDYLRQLKNYRVTVPTQYESDAIHDGKLACDLKSQGLRDYDVYQRIQARNSRTDKYTIHTLISVALLLEQ